MGDCSLLQSAGAGHQVGVLLNVEHVVLERLQSFVVFCAIASVGRGEGLGLEGFELGLILSNFLLLVHGKLLVTCVHVHTLN